MLFTKCILHAPEPEDGFRISVMSRHTLNDGVTVDRRIKDVDLHIPALGPSPFLIGSYVRKEMDWPVFAVRYRTEIQEPPKLKLVQFLAQFALVQDITMLCIEETADMCHRRILAEECKKHQPTLKVTHL